MESSKKGHTERRPHLRSFYNQRAEKLLVTDRMREVSKNLEYPEDEPNRIKEVSKKSEEGEQVLKTNFKSQL
jgi:hypothetical protein